MASVLAVIAWYLVVFGVLIALLALAYQAYGDSPEHRDNVTQTVGGLVIVLALYYASLYVLHQDALVKASTVDVRDPARTVIVDGYTESAMIVDRVFETLDPRALSFVALPKSFNRRGGAQMTYQFWIYLGDVTDANVANKVILLRGDRNVYSWNSHAGVAHQGVAIVCPSIAFGAHYNEIAVRFNTLTDIGAGYMSTANTGDIATDERHNMLKLIAKKWCLMTFVFEDNVPVSDFEDGIALRFYVNDVLYDRATFSGALRQNNGQLCLFPGVNGVPGGIKDARVADVSYYNYAVESPDIKAVFDAGPPKQHATDVVDRDNLGSPLYLSAYNALDIYNT